jgi:hypothetical protein
VQPELERTWRSRKLNGDRAIAPSFFQNNRT